ncbi:condensation domain-containing protein [Brucella gallinifaecis]|uniref:condensation domain-containing protein n=1 Tax=Brucella gallinifaecis TaxID=215590 RepID=UPI00235F5E80|nr:condensation domain-containing protein [Brucella gallinifaecis]
MNIHDDPLKSLVKQLRDNGVLLSVVSGTLRMRAPKGTVTRELQEQIQLHKEGILSFLGQEQDGVTTATLSADLTPWQRGFWLMQQREDADLGVLNNTVSLILHGQIDTARLEDAWRKVMGRHAILRARFHSQPDGSARQEVTDTTSPLQITHIGTDSAASLKAAAENILDKFATTRFDLERELPVRGHLIASPDNEHRLIICAHHIAADGWAFGILLSELFALYDDAQADLPSPLSYLDYAKDMFEQTSTSSFRERIKLEGERFAGLPACHIFPTDERRGSRGAKPGDSVAFHLDAAVTHKLAQLAREAGGSLHAVFLTCVAALYQKLTGEYCFSVMSPVANRNTSPDLEQIIGTFANASIVSTRMAAGASFMEVLKSVTNDLRTSYDRHDIPFDDALDSSGVPRIAGVYPVAQIALAWQNAAQLPESASLGIELEALSPFGRQDFFIEFRNAANGGLDGRIGFDTRLYHVETVQALAQALRSMLMAVAKNANLAIADIALAEGVLCSQPPAGKLDALGLKVGSVVFIDHGTLNEHLADAFSELGIFTTTDITKADFVMVSTNSAAAAYPPRTQLLYFNHVMPGYPALLSSPSLGLFAGLPPPNDRQAYAPAIPVRDNLEVRAWDGSALPHSLPGYIFPIHTSLRGPQAKIGPDGELLIRIDTLGSTASWVNGSFVDLDQCAALVLSSLNVADAALSIEVRDGTPELVVWVCPIGPVDYKSLETSIRTLLGDFARIDHVVRMSSLPRTLDGRIDRHRLSLLPINSPATIASKFASSRVKVATRALSRSLVFEHLCDILPSTEAVATRALPQFSSSGHERSHAAGKGSGIPALLKGPPLSDTYPPNGWNPLEWLMRAADEGRSLRSLDHDGRETHCSLADILHRSARICRGLAAEGIVKGSTVLIAARRPADMLVVFFAAMRAGVSVAPVPPPRLWQAGDPGFDRLLHVALLTGAKHVIVNEDIGEINTSLKILMASGLENINPEGDLYAWSKDETMIVSFTSGSTGKPKAVPLRSENIWAQPLGFGPALGFTGNETALNFTSLDHVASLIGFCGSALANRCNLTLISVERFLSAPEDVASRMSRWGIARSWAPDFALSLLADILNDRPAGEFDFSPMRAIYSAGECPLDATFAKLSKALARHGGHHTQLKTSWGMAETTSLLTLSEAWDGNAAHNRSNGVIDSGSPIMGSEARIVDNEGRLLQQDEVGLFEARGHQVFRGYIVLGEDGQLKPLNPLTADGWLKTGDLAYINEGRVVFLGREKDVIVINGQNVAQAAIEDTVNTLDGVDPGFTAAFASRETGTGEMKLVILFCPAGPADGTGALIRRISGSIASAYGVQPAYVLPVTRDRISKTGLGKIQRIKLRDAFESGQYASLIRDTDILLQNGRAVPSIRVDWLEKEIDVPSPPKPLLPVLLVGDGTGIASAAKRVFTGLASNILHIDADFEPAEISQSIEHGAIIVDFRSAAFVDGLASGLIGRLALVRSLRQLTSAALHFYWVERDGDDPSSIEAAVALAASIRHEFQNTTGHSLRIEPLSRPCDLSNLAAAIAAPVGAHQSKLRLCANGRLYGSSLVRKGFAQHPEIYPLPCNATIFLPGGAGEIGTVLIRQLLAWTSWRFIIGGRRAERPNTITDPRVEYLQTDASDARVLKTALSDRTIDGVVNLTGHVLRTPLAELDATVLEREIALRLNVLEALDTVFSGHDIPIVHITSINADFGRHDFLGYSVANAVQRSHIENLRAGSPKHLALPCGQWEASTGATDVNRYLAPLGFPLINATVGTAAIIRALIKRDVPGAFGVDLQGSEIAPFADLRAPLDCITISGADNAAIESIHEELHPYGTLIEIVDTGTQRPDTVSQVEAQVRAIWSNVLGIGNDIPLDANFFDMGGTSLLAARLLLRLQETFDGRPSDVIALFSHSSIRAQARLVAKAALQSPPASMPRPLTTASNTRAAGSMADRRRAALAKLPRSKE